MSSPPQSPRLAGAAHRSSALLPTPTPQSASALRCSRPVPCRVRWLRRSLPRRAAQRLAASCASAAVASAVPSSVASAALSSPTSLSSPPSPSPPSPPASPPHPSPPPSMPPLRRRRFSLRRCRAGDRACNRRLVRSRAHVQASTLGARRPHAPRLSAHTTGDCTRLRLITPECAPVARRGVKAVLVCALRGSGTGLIVAS